MIEAGTNTDANREIVKIDSSKQALVSRVRGKRKRRKNKYSLINSSNCRYDLVRFTATKFSIKESLENWNIYWTDLSISVQRCKEMKRFQRINHFPGMMEICRKDLLARNLNRLYKAFPEEYNVFPKTWCLPTDMAEVTEYAKTHKGKCFIVKPDQGCQGRGIAITKNINQLKTYDKMICQQYIQRPFLIDGYKFDLRIYVLITSCDPMRLFVYNEGLARFATAKYKEPNVLNASNMYMHLTNYSVNKHSRTYIVDDIDGSKRKLSTINQWFQKNNYDIKKIWDSIDDVIIKTMIVSLPTLKHYYHTCFPNHSTSHSCFEILGFDFMFDCRLKPYVLEVNHSPSFNTETTIDHEVKESLLYDTFNILNLQHNNRFRVLIEDKKRARDRLFSVTHSPEILSREKAHEDRISQHRVEWENTHLGNYRKIYPGNKDEYYDKFIGARQNTMYAETVSSKAKEAAPKVGEQAGPSRAKAKKMKASVPDGLSPLKSKEGGGDGLMQEESKTTGASKPSPMVFEHDETSKSVEKPALVNPESPANSVGSKKSKIVVDKVEREKELTTSEPNKPTVLPADPEKIDELDEMERISNMKKREFLIKSHGILEKVYENLKNAGLLKLETDIKVGRSNKWETGGEGSKAYIDGYQKFNKSMVQVLDCISKKVDIRLQDKVKSGDFLPGSGFGLDKPAVHQKSHSMTNGTRLEITNGTFQEDFSRQPPMTVEIPDGITQKTGMRVPEKTKSGDFLHGSGFGLDKPAVHQKSLSMYNGARLEINNVGTSQEDFSRKFPVTVEILDGISEKTGMRVPEKVKSGNLLLDSGFVFDKPAGHQKSLSVSNRARLDTTAGTLRDEFSRKPQVPEKVKSGDVLLNYGLGLDRSCSTAGNRMSHSMPIGRRVEVSNSGAYQDDISRRPPMTALVPNGIMQKAGMRDPEKVKSGEVVPNFGLGLDRPRTTAGNRMPHSMPSGRRTEVSNAGPIQDGLSRRPPATVEALDPLSRKTGMRVPDKFKTSDVLPESLLKIERPFTSAGYHKTHSFSSERRFDISDDFSRKPPVTVEVVTPYVRQTASDRLFEREQKPVTAQGSVRAAPVLKIGHFGKPEAWGSLEEYFEQRKILNRSWQNTDV